MNPTEPRQPAVGNPNRPRRVKPHAPAAPRASAEIGRRGTQVHTGREFVYATKGEGRTNNGSRSNAESHGRALAPGTAPHHYSKVRPGIRRRRNVKLRNIWSTVGYLVLLISVVFGGFELMNNPECATANVVVNGLSAQDAARIQGFVERQALGENVFRFWLTSHSGVASRIKSSDPELKSVSLKVQFPNTIAVNVIESRPDVLVVFGKNGSLGAWMLDATGLPVRNQLSARWNERPADLLKVYVDPKLASSTDLAMITLGQPLPSDMLPIVGDIHAVRNSLSLSQLGTQVASVRIDNSGYLGLNMKSHLLVKLGDITSLDKKIALADALITQRTDLVAGDRYIDVSDPDWPAVMPASKGQPITGIASTPIAPALGTNYETQPGVALH